MMRWPVRKVWQTSGIANSMRARLPGVNGSGFLEAVAEFAAERLAAHQLLIAAHVDSGWIGIGIGIIGGIHVDQLDDEIGIGAGGGDATARRDRAGDGDVVFQRLGLIHQHVGAPGGEALIVGHVIAGHALRRSRRCTGTGLAGSLTYSSKPTSLDRLSNDSLPAASRCRSRVTAFLGGQESNLSH